MIKLSRPRILTHKIVQICIAFKIQYTNPKASQMKILIVEDNHLLLKVVETKLKKEGYQVICCDNGKDAIEEIMCSSPDMVITDIMLPYSSGLEIVNFVKVTLKKNIPVMVMSGIGQEKTVEEAFKLGADDYMTKPLSLSELSMRIKRFSRVFTATETPANTIFNSTDLASDVHVF